LGEDGVFESDGSDGERRAPFGEGEERDLGEGGAGGGGLSSVNVVGLLTEGFDNRFGEGVAAVAVVGC